MPPYDPDSQFGSSSLCRLEAATGMKVMTPIVERLGQFNTDFHFRLEAAGMRLRTQAGDELMALVAGTPPVGLTADKVKIILLFLETMEPKTWRTLYSILNVLDMEGLVEEIEFYLSSKCQWECLSLDSWWLVASVHGRSHPVLVPGVRSLKEQCTSVIVCGLLEQWALDADQVTARLPDYVPPTIKHFIASRYRAHKTPKCNY